MGNPEATEEDQLRIANVSISENKKVFSERKINFFILFLHREMLY